MRHIGESVKSEYPEVIAELSNISEWDYVGCTGTQFSYGKLSTWSICINGEYYWFDYVGERSYSSLAKYCLGYYDDVSSAIHDALSYCLYYSLTRKIM